MADINALYRSLLAADEAHDAAALTAVAWQMYGQLATAAANLGALRARFRVYAVVPQASGMRWSASRRARTGADLPCADDPELFFAESPDEVETAKALCDGCPARAACLAGALGSLGRRALLARHDHAAQATAGTPAQDGRGCLTARIVMPAVRNPRTCGPIRAAEDHKCMPSS